MRCRADGAHRRIVEGCLRIFLKTVGFYWKCAAKKYEYLNRGGDCSFLALSYGSGCNASMANEWKLTAKRRGKISVRSG